VGKSFEEIAAVINKSIIERAAAGGFDFYPQRTPRAIAFQCQKLGLITGEELEVWDKEQRETVAKRRRSDRYRMRKRVFERDEHKCVVCKQEREIECAHIIPFIASQKNIVQEAVCLCKYHHRHFDKGCSKCVEKVFLRMSQYYQHYKDQYEINEYECGTKRIIRVKSHAAGEN
jgi:hypothetical protein